MGTEFFFEKRLVNKNKITFFTEEIFTKKFANAVCNKNKDFVMKFIRRFKRERGGREKKKERWRKRKGENKT